jgi:Mrp family chromosome partitioning ATPase
MASTRAGRGTCGRDAVIAAEAPNEPRAVLLASAVAGEGATTVATGLARAAASSGLTVILVEADLKAAVLAHTRLEAVRTIPILCRLASPSAGVGAQSE